MAVQSVRERDPLHHLPAVQDVTELQPQNLKILYDKAFTSQNPANLLLSQANPYEQPFQTGRPWNPQAPARYPDITTLPGVETQDYYEIARQAIMNKEAVETFGERDSRTDPNKSETDANAIKREIAYNAYDDYSTG